MNKILFVCMGNICRSPSAEGFFRHHARRRGVADGMEIDSAGTHSYHLGNPPDHRAIAAAAARGVDIANLRARRVTHEDFGHFDLVVAMDEANRDTLQRLRDWELPAGQGAEGLADLRLMMEFSPRFDTLREVPDPYYGSGRDFEIMCDLLDEACSGLLDWIGDRVGVGAGHGPGRD